MRKTAIEKGQRRTLDAAQEAETRKLVPDKTPEQFRLIFALWLRQTVEQPIKIRFEIAMPIRTVSEYLKRQCFEPQTPLKRAYAQCQHRRGNGWVNNIQPSRREPSEKNRKSTGQIETGASNDYHLGRGFSVKGKTSIINLPARRSSINKISSITNQGEVRFMIFRSGTDPQCSFVF